jgi:hypothetical protein
VGLFLAAESGWPSGNSTQPHTNSGGVNSTLLSADSLDRTAFISGMHFAA